MKALKLTGVAMAVELKRILTLVDRPYMSVQLTDPRHPGGLIYDGTRLVSLCSSLDSSGKLQDMTITVTLDPREHDFKWHPDGSTEPKSATEMIGLDVFWGQQEDSSPERVGMGDSELERFLSSLPQQPETTIVDEQRRLEKMLPKVVEGRLPLRSRR